MKQVEGKYGEVLRALEAEGRLRVIPQEVSGLVDLSSNDYLGLSRHADDLAEEFLLTRQCANFSSSASRLLSRRQREHNLLERDLNDLYGKHTLLFNSGYHANCGALSALAIPGVTIFADRLSHASMIDGMILSRNRFERFRHNDTEHLRRLLARDKESDVQLVVTEAIFSMDGDEAPLAELVEMKKEFPRMMIYLDEAHSFGVRGERGLGLAEQLGLIDNVDILLGTFGKAACSAGAFIATSATLRDYLLNTARSFIFSTALPPVNVAFTRFILTKIIAMQSEREHLAALAASFRSAVARASGAPMPSTSQIVPWIIGDATRAVATATRLRDAGFDALAIRRPTVPPGGERIRFSLNASLSETALQPLVSAIGKIAQTK